MKNVNLNAVLNHSTSYYRAALALTIIALFFLANLIPLIGPGILGFMLGTSSFMHQKVYHLKIGSQLTAILIGTCLAYCLIAISLGELNYQLGLLIFAAIIVNFSITHKLFNIGSRYNTDTE